MSHKAVDGSRTNFPRIPPSQCLHPRRRPLHQLTHDTTITSDTAGPCAITASRDIIYHCLACTAPTLRPVTLCVAFERSCGSRGRIEETRRASVAAVGCVCAAGCQGSSNRSACFHSLYTSTQNTHLQFILLRRRAGPRDTVLRRQNRAAKVLAERSACGVRSSSRDAPIPTCLRLV